ncbi:heavy metal translocating P-type ATPase, partial [Planococcus sp. SIMBA_143]
RQPGMMLLIALGITVAFLASWAATVGLVHPELEFWWELALLIVIMLLGHWIEMRSINNASKALESLASLMPDTAHRISEDGSTDEVRVDEIKAGDHVLVKPGDK